MIGCPHLAADLVSRKVDVIVTAGGDPCSTRGEKCDLDYPDHFLHGGDPVELGLVASLARPGGNLTGIAAMATELMPKRLELLSELVPQARVIALLVNPNVPTTSQIRDRAGSGAREGIAARYPQGQHRRRDRRRLRLPRPAASRRAPRRRQIRFSAAGASNLWRWRHAMPFPRFINGASSSRPAA